MEKITLFIVPVILIAFCACQVKGIPSAKPDTAGQTSTVRKIGAAEAKELLASENASLLVDVREPYEFASGHIPGSVNIPLGTVVDGLSQLNLEENGPVMLYCRSGSRSAAAAKMLLKAGFNNLYDLGGIMDWPYETVK